jgi:hypothetical protein
MLKNFDEFLNETKQFKGGKPDAEENTASFYEIAKLKDDQKKMVEALVNKAAAEGNINTNQNYKVLIVGKLAGLDDKAVEDLEKMIDKKNEEFIFYAMIKLAKLTMEQAKAFSEL